MSWELSISFTVGPFYHNVQLAEGIPRRGDEHEQASECFLFTAPRAFNGSSYGLHGRTRGDGWACAKSLRPAPYRMNRLVAVCDLQVNSLNFMLTTTPQPLVAKLSNWTSIVACDLNCPMCGDGAGGSATLRWRGNFSRLAGSQAEAEGSRLPNQHPSTAPRVAPSRIRSNYQ